MNSAPAKNFWIGVGFAALTALLWGFLGFSLKRAFQFSDPSTVSWFRFLFSFLTLGLYVFFREPETRAVIRKIPFWMILAALLLSMNYVGYAKGVQITTPGNAQMLIQMGPLFVLLGGILILREKLNLRQWLGVGVASAGFLIFYRDQLAFLIESREQFQIGNAWLLFGSLTWAAWALMQKRATLLGFSSRSLNLFVYGWSAVFLFPFADLSPFLHFGSFEWILMILLGLNTLVAYGSFAAAMDQAPTAIVNLVVATNPLLALAFSSDEVHLFGWIGAFLVLLGVVLTLKPQVSSKG